MSVASKKQAQAVPGNQAAKVKLEVDLKPSWNPPVLISDRKKKAASGDTIEWSKVSGAPTFSFSAFQPQSTPFQNIDVKPNKIECDFNPPPADPAGTEYPYTIVVTSNGQTYTSDEVITNPTGGRAVIRN